MNLLSNCTAQVSGLPNTLITPPEPCHGDGMVTSAVDGHSLRLFAYVLTFVVCVATARNSGTVGQRRLWLAIILAVLGLGLVRLFGWDNEIASHVRDDAYQGGWYRGRRPVQEAVIAGLLGTALAALGAAVLMVRAARGFRLTALAGVGLLAAFVCIRAVSLHDIDHALFAETTLGIQRSALIELGLLGAIFVSALLDFGLARRRAHGGTRLSRSRIDRRSSAAREPAVPPGGSG